MPETNHIQANHFQRLHIGAAFDIDADELEAHYLQLSRALHPDLAAPDDQSQAAATDAMSRLNESYATLRDPLRRAEYLLLLRGGMPAEQDHSLPEGFLQLILELREEVEEARERDEVERASRLLRQVQEQREELLHQAAAGFREPVTARGLHELRRALNALRYLDRVLAAAKVD